MARPVVALLSDFGTADHYAGTMKAVVLGVCPDVTLVDIAHDLPAHDVMAGALQLAACYKYFPAGTVFLVVVDPLHLRYRTYPASRARQRALLTGDIIRMFKGLRVSDSFLMKSNVREMLFRKNPV